MDYEKFFKDYQFDMQITPKFFKKDKISNSFIYLSETDTTVTVKSVYVVECTIYKNNLDNIISEYPETKEIFNEYDFETKRDGKVYPYLLFVGGQDIFLTFYKNTLDKLIQDPKDFELDTSILEKVNFEYYDGYALFNGKKIRAKKKYKAFEKAFNLPINDYNEIYDTLVKVERK